MDLPLITIAIPTYKQPQYLEKAIQSALKQDYAKKEIIVAEDGACHEAQTNILLLQKKYPQIKFFINKVRLGRVANYKKLLTDYATGDFYINLDGDDYFTEDTFISYAVDKIKNAGFNNVLLFQGAHKGKSIDEEILFSPRINGTDIILSGKEYLKNYFRISHFSHMSTLYNRKIALKAGFYEKDIISSDILSIFNMVVKYPEKNIIISKKISGMWSMHDNNASKTLKLTHHVKNFKLFTVSFLNQLRSPAFSKSASIKWYARAFINYWYIHFIKKIINR